MNIWQNSHAVLLQPQSGSAQRLAAFRHQIIIMGVSELIEAKADVTFEATLDEAQQITEEINENTDEEGNFITKAWDKITGGISGLADRGEELFVDFLESIAVLLATSCVIPIAVLLAALWAIKAFFGIPFHMPAPHKGIGRSKGTNDAD